VYLTPREFVQMARAFCKRRRRRKAARIGLLFFPAKGNAMNPVTAGPGARITGTVNGKDANGAPALVKTPVAWATDNAIPNLTLTPSGDGLSAAIQVPADFTSGSTVITVTTADNLTATGTLNVAEGAAVSISLDFTINP
jgi:hypothetical protein